MGFLPLMHDDAINHEHRESIANKKTIRARTTRTIVGAAPSSYLSVIETRAQIAAQRLDELIATHLIPTEFRRADDFDAHFTSRREAAAPVSRVSHRQGRATRHRSRLRQWRLRTVRAQ